MSDTWAQLGAKLRAAAEGPVDERQAQARRLAAAMRGLIEGLVDDGVGSSALAAATKHVEAALSALGGKRDGASAALGAGDEAFAGFFDNSPMVGLANPVAPPLRLATRERDVVGSVRFGAAYEGPPGHVHGGFIAATFDEVLGMAQSLSGSPGMTGTLTVRFRRPTPLNADLLVEGRLDRIEGRKVFAKGELRHDGEVTAEAEAIFIAVDFSTMHPSR